MKKIFVLFLAAILVFAPMTFSFAQENDEVVAVSPTIETVVENTVDDETVKAAEDEATLVVEETAGPQAQIQNAMEEEAILTSSYDPDKVLITAPPIGAIITTGTKLAINVDIANCAGMYYALVISSVEGFSVSELLRIDQITPSNYGTTQVYWDTAGYPPGSYVISAMLGNAPIVYNASYDNSTFRDSHPINLVAPDDNAIDKFVVRLYTLTLGREPDAAELKKWGDTLKAGTSGTQVAYGFFFSDEYNAKNTSNTQYVTTLYKVLLDRDPDASGLAAWKHKLDNGMSREHIFGAVANSYEFALLCSKAQIMQGSYTSSQPRDQNYDITAFVTRLYRLCLERDPDAHGLNDWTAKLLNGEDGAKIAYGFFFSDEMINRRLGNSEYVQILYRTLMNREPDEQGYTDWMQALNQEVSTLQVFGGFVYSPEFTQLCANYGIVRGIY